MATQFIAIQEATRIFSKAMQPYKKWLEKVHISSLIEIDEKLYRSVCTLSRFNRKYLRKVVLCTEQGEIVKSQELVQRHFEILTYLHYFKVFSNDIAFDATQYGEEKFGAVKSSLNKLYHELFSKLSKSEQTAITEHLTYYDEMIYWLDELAELSKECLKLIEQLKQLTADDTLTADFIDYMHRMMIKREKIRNNVEAVILENGLKVRRSIKAILHDDKYTKHISNNDDKTRVLVETDNAQNIEYKVIQNGKKDWKVIEKWLEIDKGKFTVEKYVSDLFDSEHAKIFFLVNTKLIATEHWVYSRKLKY